MKAQEHEAAGVGHVELGGLGESTSRFLRQKGFAVGTDCEPQAGRIAPQPEAQHDPQHAPPQQEALPVLSAAVALPAKPFVLAQQLGKHRKLPVHRFILPINQQQARCSPMIHTLPRFPFPTLKSVRFPGGG